MKKIVSILFVTTLISCSVSSNEDRPSSWHGDWNARWETPPASYPGLDSTMTFYMNGSFVITADSLTVNANGFEGCIFNSDTLTHTQSWSVSNDTLFLLSAPQQAGITYTVKSFRSDRIELQLMEDIFVTLTK